MASPRQVYFEPAEENAPYYELQEISDNSRSVLSGTKSRSNIFLILGVIALYSVISMLPFTVNIDIIYALICRPLNLQQHECLTSSEASDKVAVFTSAITILRGLLSIIMNTILGTLSDAIGRKPVAFGGIMVSGIAQLTWWSLAFSGALSTHWWLILPILIDGLGGSQSVVNMAIVSYITDSTTNVSQRTRFFAVLDGLTHLSVAIGPTLGSLIIHWTSQNVLYILTFSSTFLCGILLHFSMNDNPWRAHGHQAVKEHLQPKEILANLLFSRLNNQREKTNSRIMLLCSLLGTDIAMTFVYVIFLYPKRLFGWSAVESGYYISVTALWRAFCLVIGFPIVSFCFSRLWTINPHGIDKVDANLVRFALLMCACGYLVMGLSKNSLQFYLGGVLDATSAIGAPAYKGALLKVVPPERSGSFQAAMSIVMSIIGVLLPPLFLKLMSWSFQWLPSFSFDILVLVFLVLLSFTFLLIPKSA